MPEVALHGHRYGQGAGRSADPGFRRNRPSRQRAAAVHRAREGAFMLDIVMLALGLGFFVVAVGYTYACERL
jgi:hypothetical protein